MIFLKLFKSFFGGGSTVAYVILFAVVGGIYLKYDLTMKANKQLRIDIKAVTAQSNAKTNTIASQARQGQRKADSQKGLSDAEAKINDVPDSNACAQSEPIKVAFDILREKQAKPDE